MVPWQDARMSIPTLALLELPEAAATRSAFDAARSLAGNPFDVATSEVSGVFAVRMGAIPMGFFNRVVGLGATRAPVEEDIASPTSWFEDAGIPQSMFQVAPAAETPQVQAWLTAHGHRASRNWVKLFRGLDDLPTVQSEIVIERIGPEDAVAWSEIVATAMQMPSMLAPFAAAVVGEPGWTIYLGRLDGRPVSAAAMYVHEGTAWMGYGTTLADARGRGGQRGMFATRLADAKAVGCTLAVTETGEETEEEPVNPSYRNMLAMGFELAYARRNWVRG
jgi:hypothetical protein